MKLATNSTSKNIAITTFIVLIVYLVINIVQFSLPLYLKFLGLTFSVLGLVMSLSSFIRVITSFVTGFVMRLHGICRTFMLGCVLTSVSIFLLCSKDVNVITLSRALFGISGSLLIPSLWTFVSSVASKSDMPGRVVSLCNMMTGIGMILGFSISGFLITLIGYESLFVLASILMLLTLPLAYVVGISEEYKPRCIISLRMLLSRLKNFKLFLLFLVAFFEMYILYSWLTFTQVYLKIVGFDKRVIGLIMSLEVVIYTILQPAVGYLIDKLGKVSPLLLCTAPIYGLLLSLIPHTKDLLHIILLMIGIAVVTSPYAPTVFTLLTLLTSEEEREVVVSTFFTFIHIGIGLGQAITGVLSQFSLSVAYAHLGFLTIIMFLIGLVLYLRHYRAVL